MRGKIKPTHALLEGEVPKLKLDLTSEGIGLTKELNDLDRLAQEFTAILDEVGVSYVIISGYVVLLFGHSRTSEDIDIIITRPTREVFERLWEALRKRFECHNTTIIDSAYNEYLDANLALRFSYIGDIIPNIELKMPKVKLDRWTLAHRICVNLNNKPIFISPFELQIPYKLYLGGDKDIEDARYLYNIFKNYLDNALFMRFIDELGQKQAFKRWLDG